MVVLGPMSSWMAGDTVGGLRGKDRADAMNAVRQTLLAGFAGASVLLGLAYTARTYQLSRRGQVADRFSRSVGQLASDKLAERLGGIYGLEQVMVESSQEHATVVGVLSAFIRENTRRSDSPSLDEDSSSRPLPAWGTEPSADIRAATEVLARRPQRQEARRLDLRSAQLTGISLRSYDFHAPPRLTRTLLTWAVLCRADLRGADLSGSILTKADLRHALLARACLDQALMAEADLRGALLDDAVLLRADLSGADLRNTTGLTARQLAGAVIDEGTRLPPQIASDPWVAARRAACRAWRDQPHQETSPPPTAAPAR
ncbi:pentapeptide repeat-containing protein [Streptomyces sp. 8L]|uniref:pentapeptide repeat-containing protein n=1 Tax=Streptomyces sp. 8L TaxID=2877242 RepID=UPI001CD63931|nr:pentapeptide repeat-containing protein [Streptomyces sp. 8L]MCA1224302.1 pentapeptide repeat-containing protein [Streptomyces sp. 8L]